MLDFCSMVVTAKLLLNMQDPACKDQAAAHPAVLIFGSLWR
jgi:hypothetical protein